MIQIQFKFETKFYPINAFQIYTIIKCCLVHHHSYQGLLYNIITCYVEIPAAISGHFILSGSVRRPYRTYRQLTHWGRATLICVGKLTIIGSDNGLSPGRRQAIIWTTAGILLIRPLGTNFNEILIGIQTFSFKKMHLKMSSAKWRPLVSASMC